MDSDRRQIFGHLGMSEGAREMRGLRKGIRKLLGWSLCSLFYLEWWFYEQIHMPKFTKLYILNMGGLLYASYLLIKLLERRKRSRKVRRRKKEERIDT